MNCNILIPDSFYLNFLNLIKKLNPNLNLNILTFQKDTFEDLTISSSDYNIALIDNPFLVSFYKTLENLKADEEIYEQNIKEYKQYEIYIKNFLSNFLVYDKEKDNIKTFFKEKLNFNLIFEESYYEPSLNLFMLHNNNLKTFLFKKTEFLKECCKDLLRNYDLNFKKIFKNLEIEENIQNFEQRNLQKNHFRKRKKSKNQSNSKYSNLLYQFK